MAVMVVVPPLNTVMRPLVGWIVATDVSELLYVIAPELSDVGIVGVNGWSPRVLVRPPPEKKYPLPSYVAVPPGGVKYTLIASPPVYSPN